MLIVVSTSNKVFNLYGICYEPRNQDTHSNKDILIMETGLVSQECEEEWRSIVKKRKISINFLIVVYR